MGFSKVQQHMISDKVLSRLKSSGGLNSDLLGVKRRSAKANADSSDSSVDGVSDKPAIELKQKSAAASQRV